MNIMIQMYATGAHKARSRKAAGVFPNVRIGIKGHPFRVSLAGHPVVTKAVALQCCSGALAAALLVRFLFGRGGVGVLIQSLTGFVATGFP